MGEALGARVERLERTAGIITRLNVEGDDASIPVEAAAELFRIAEEALTNVQRHAQARHALVNLTVGDGEIRLVVEDDGVGMTAGAGASEGFGLTGMKERAERVGGRLRIESEPGEGTRVEAIIATKADGSQQ